MTFLDALAQNQTPTRPDDLNELIRIWSSTTLAPWLVGKLNSRQWQLSTQNPGGANLATFQDGANALFCAEAHRLVPRLVAEVRRLTEEREALAAEVEKARESSGKAPATAKR